MTAANIADRVVEMAVASMESSSITIGARLGWWSALADAGDAGIDSNALAKRSGAHPRYVREWLAAMGAGGWLVVTDSASDAADARTYALAPGVREVLVDADSDLYLAPLLRQVSAGQLSLRTLERVFQTGEGLAWADHDPDMVVAQGEMNRNPLRKDLPPWIREHLPDTAAALDGGVWVADVGTGHGWASIGLASMFPNATVHAYDLDEPSVAAARTNVHEAGLDGHVTVYADSIDSAEPGAYRLVVMAEMLHDVPDPIGLLAACRKALADDGVVFVADMRVGESYSAPADLVERLMYGFSLLVCLADSMTTRPSAATGTVIRPSILQEYARQAGFTDVRELPIEHDTWRFWALRA
ncbi:class I SAM-dependent methyltransferase [Solicola gregarius]|uniref:Methyltransferase domain-containing protein n=1 Tax=Solicola gregarius TaxID=2908642 RepID=A0AA46TFU7_9ACTN|nr:class I SAM-dependent methyltransferase [Solicola gregarius]UYM04569.1 methyltransferase domain-containing protein [Solicola gregarius]